MYDIVGRPTDKIIEDSIPDVIKYNDIKVIVRYDDNTLEENAKKIIEYYKLK